MYCTRRTNYIQDYRDVYQALEPEFRGFGTYNIPVLRITARAKRFVLTSYDPGMQHTQRVRGEMLGSGQFT